MCGNSYLDLLFDTKRLGFIDVSEKILTYLDYQGFVNFKQSCKFVYNFLGQRPQLEEASLKRKLSSDWLTTPEQFPIQVKGVVAHARIFDDGRQIACAIEREVQIFEISSGHCKLVLSGPHVASVSAVEIIYNQDGNREIESHTDRKVEMFVSGCREGILAFWSPDGELLVRKQLFGRIMSIKCRGRHLATAHFGKPFDAGCIMIRQVNSKDDMPVVFSLYEDMFPVISMDFTSDLVAALEWNGTFNGVEAGNINIYKWHNKVPVAYLSDRVDCTFSTVRFVGTSGLLTGGHDELIRLWKIIDCPNSFDVECVRVFSAHEAIISRLEVCSDRAVSRDTSGKIIVWDLPLMYHPDKNATLREFVTKKRPAATMTCMSGPCITMSSVALSPRQLFVNSNAHVQVLDFWSTSAASTASTELIPMIPTVASNVATITLPS